MKKLKLLAVGAITAMLLGGCMSPTRAIDRVQVDAAHPESLGGKKIEALRDIGVAEASRLGWYPGQWYGGIYGVPTPLPTTWYWH